MSVRSRIARTPARLAGLRDSVDTDIPPIPRATAAGVMAAIYLLFFAVGILNALHVLRTGIVLDETDYGSFRGISEIVTRAAEIGGAIVVLFLITRWLTIPRALAGIPRHPATPLPALLTIAIAVGGLAVATAVRSLVEQPGGSPNNDGGGIIANPAALLSLVSALSAGVVEEIVIVAVPVLVGRRAGWHPVAIIALAAALRIPFHLYQGAAAIPWAIIWGAAYAAAYVYLRRLLPLIAVHAALDAAVMLKAAYGLIGFYAVELVGMLALAALALRTIPDRRRRLNPDAPTATRPAARIIWHHTSTRARLRLASLACLPVAVLVGFIYSAPDDTTRASLIVAYATGAAVVAIVCWRSWTAANMILIQTPERIGVIRWHTTYTGQSRIDSLSGFDDVEAIRRVAEFDHQTVVLVAGNRDRRQRFHDLGYLPTANFTFRTIRVPADQAIDLRIAKNG